MRSHTLLTAALACAFACIPASGAAQSADPSPRIRQILAPTGTLRIGVYPGSPTSMLRDPASGEAKGVSVEVGQALAKRLGVGWELVEFPRIAAVIDGIRAGGADFTISNASPSRAKDVDFTPPVLAVELGYLLPSGSTVSSYEEVDRPGMRVGVTQGSTSQKTLPGRLKSAALVAAPTLKAGIDMLSRHELDAFATNKAILFEMSDSLPGSRVLPGRWGVEHMAIAVPKGREAAMPYMQAFITDIAAQGLVRRAAERAGLRGLASEAAR